MRPIISAYIIFCLTFFSACVTEPKLTPNVTNPSVVLPEKVLIDGIKIERRQSFKDCVPVCLEAVFKFYGKIIDRKEIDEQVHKSWGGSKTKDWIMYVKEQGFNVYSFYDRTKDKRGIKFFLAQYLPVLAIGSVRTGFQSHMVILIGYDDRKKFFYVADPEWKAIQEGRYLDFNEWHKQQKNRG